MSDGQDSSTASGATVSDDTITNIVLESGAVSTGNNFGEAGVFSEYISINMFFASSASPEECLLETVAQAEELSGHVNLADCIRNGDTSFEDQNTAPSGNVDAYSVTTGNVLTVEVAMGVLANDEDIDGDLLTANMVTLPDNGTIAFSPDGSFVYTPIEGFTGTDSFTYVADDGSVTCEEIAVSVTVGSGCEGSPEEDEASIQAVDAALALLASDADSP